MKNKILTLCLLLMGTYASSSTAGEWLVGARAGVIDIDAPNADPGVAAYLMVGKEMWDIGAADVAIEGEAGFTVVDGEIDNQETSFDTVGAYMSLRTKGPFYLIGRGGVTTSGIDTVQTGQDVEDDETKPTFGIGFGFSGIGLKWEVLFTSYGTGNTDVDVVSLGLLF